jgi:Protein of unknown function (DUF3108)
MRTLTRILPLALAAALILSPCGPILQAQQASISATPQSAIEPAAEAHRFPTQTLHYDAEWRLWKAGTATLRIEPSGEMEHVVATAEASGAVAVLYRVQDRLESYFDHRTNCSDRILKHSEEGFHKRETTLLFHAAPGKSILDERNLRSGETKHQVTDSPACVTDVISGIYYLGSLRLEPGFVHVFPVNDGGKTVDVTAFVEGREDIKTDAGTFRTVRVAVYSGATPLRGRGKIWLWYTDDAAHLPVQMRSRLFWGTMTLRLTRVEK